MKTNHTSITQRFDKELVMLVHAQCNCTICTAQKNRIKKEMGERQFYKVYDEIKHSYAR